MRPILKKLSVTLIFLVSAVVGFSQSVNLATFNVRFDNRSDSGNLWENRVDAVCNLIKYHNFDIMGTQEGLFHQLNDIKQRLPQFTWIGNGRDDGKTQGEFSAIFYNHTKYSVIASGDFWLSETPNQPGKGWDATCCNRICTWANLKEKRSGKTFYVFNAHYDHQGQQARRESSLLMLKKIKEIAGNQPAIFCGDLNADNQTEPYHLLARSQILSDTRSKAPFAYAPSGSFNGFGKSYTTGVIDHIFATSHFLVQGWGVLTDTYGVGKFPSDHFPVKATLLLKK